MVLNYATALKETIDSINVYIEKQNLQDNIHFAPTPVDNLTIENSHRFKLIEAIFENNHSYEINVNLIACMDKSIQELESIVTKIVNESISPNLEIVLVKKNDFNKDAATISFSIMKSDSYETQTL